MQELIGKLVTLYLDGGWEASGKISIADENKLVLINETGKMVVFRSKICLVLMNDDEAAEEADSLKPALAKYRNQSDRVIENTLEDDEFEINGVNSGNAYGSFIPGDLLDGPPIDGGKYQVDFGITQASLERVETRILGEVKAKDGSSK